MDTVISLIDAVPYLRAYAGRSFVVKVGGELLDAPWLAGVARDVAVLHRLGIRVILVHGGGPQLDRELAAGGISTERVGGRRITCEATIGEAVKTWRGQLSTRLVLALHGEGEHAVGLSGADAGLIHAKRRPPAVITDDDGTTRTVDFGEVGDITEVRTDVIEAVLGTGSIPVISPLALGSSGVLNVNADTVAAQVAVAIGAEKLVLLTRAMGILRDPDDPTSAMHQTDLDELAELERAGVLSGGMRPKAAAIRLALRGGVARAHVIDGRRSGALLEEVFTPAGCGTLVVSERPQAQTAQV